MLRLFPLCVCLVLMCPLAPAVAQDNSSRVFLRYTGSDAAVAALEGASMRFERVIYQASAIQFAGTTEMEAVYAECREAIGVSVAEERECQLQAARRLSVGRVIEIELAPLDRDHHELTLQVWDPDANTRVHGDFIEVEADSLDAAARAGMPRLAHSYLCSIGVEASCSPQATADATQPSTHAPPVEDGGVLEVVGVTPSPVEVIVAGVSLGTGPGQFDVSPGTVDVTLRATGYVDYTNSVRVRPGGVPTVVRNVTLEPLPAVVTLECNVAGATIRVDGTEVGTTRRNRGVELSLAPSSRRIEVVREGYEIGRAHV